MDSERVYYADEGGVRITSTRAIFENTTYSMANISSVTTNEEPPSRMGSVLTILVGLLFMTGAFFMEQNYLWIAGILMLIIGILWIITSRPIYHLMIRSAAGEESAIHSKNREYIVKVAHAINEAFIGRG